MASDKKSPGGTSSSDGTSSGASAKSGSGSSSSSSGSKRPVTIDLKPEKVSGKSDTTTSSSGKPGSTPSSARSTKSPLGGSDKGSGSGTSKSTDASSTQTSSTRSSSSYSSSKPSTGAGAGSSSSSSYQSKTTKPETAASGPTGTASSSTSGKTTGSGSTSRTPGSTSFSNPPAAQDSGGVGAFGVLIAAFIGGVIVLGGGFGLYQAGFVTLSPEPNQQISNALSDARKKISELESKVGDLGTALSRQDTSSAVSALETKLAALEKKVEETAGADTSELSGALDTVKKDIEALKVDMASVGSADGSGPTGGSSVDLKPLEDRLASLEESVKSAPSLDLAPIETRLKDLEGGSSAAVSEADKLSGAVTDLAGEVKSVEMQLAELQSRLQNTEATAKAAQTAVSTSDVSLKTLADSQARATETLSSLSSDIQSVGAANTAALETLRSELDSLSKRLAQVESTMGDATARETAARALSVSALKSAVDSGRPYQTELAAVKAGLPSGMDLKALESHAGTGVEPVPVLIAQFPEVARQVYQTFSEPEESGDVLESFLASARAIVAVRGPGNTDGTGPDAVLRRMEHAVSKGDLSAAIAASKDLPDAGQKAAADWSTRAQARVEVDALTDKASQEVLNALAGNDS